MSWMCSHQNQMFSHQNQSCENYRTLLIICKFSLSTNSPVYANSPPKSPFSSSFANFCLTPHSLLYCSVSSLDGWIQRQWQQDHTETFWRRSYLELGGLFAPVEASMERASLHWCCAVALEKAGGVWRVEKSEHFFNRWSRRVRIFVSARRVSFKSKLVVKKFQ
jgi:hypothetical protein